MIWNSWGNLIHIYIHYNKLILSFTHGTTKSKKARCESVKGISVSKLWKYLKGPQYFLLCWNWGVFPSEACSLTVSNIENPAVFFFIFQFWFWFCMLWTGRRIWNWRSKSAEEPRQHLLSNQAQRRSQWKKRQPKLRWKWPWLSRCALFFHEPLYLRWHHHRIPGAVLNLCWVFLSLISLSDQWCYGLVAFLFC